MAAKQWPTKPAQKLQWSNDPQMDWAKAHPKGDTVYGVHGVWNTKSVEEGRPDHYALMHYHPDDSPTTFIGRYKTKDEAKSVAERHHISTHYGLTPEDHHAWETAYPDRPIRTAMGQHPDAVRVELNRAHEAMGNPHLKKSDVLRKEAGGADLGGSTDAIAMPNIVSSPTVRRFLRTLSSRMRDTQPGFKPGDRVVHKYLGLGKIKARFNPKYDDPKLGPRYVVAYPEASIALHHGELTPVEIPDIKTKPVPIKANAKAAVPAAPPHPALVATMNMKPHMGAVVQAQKEQQAQQLQAMQEGQGGEAGGEGGDSAGGPPKDVKKSLMKSMKTDKKNENMHVSSDKHYIFTRWRSRHGDLGRRYYLHQWHVVHYPDPDNPQQHEEVGKHHTMKGAKELAEKHAAGIKKSLAKGAMARLAPFDPRQIPPVHRDQVYNWTNLAMQYERERIPRLEGSGRTRALHRLSKQTQTRKASDGKREFLLHRGAGHKESPDTYRAQRSSWTPDKSQAALYGKHVNSAWVHENQIAHVPNQIGRSKVGRGHVGESEGTYRTNRIHAPGKPSFHADQEVIVEPHKLEPFHHEASQTVHERINERAQSGRDNSIAHQDQWKAGTKPGAKLVPAGPAEPAFKSDIGPKDTYDDFVRRLRGA